MDHLYEAQQKANRRFVLHYGDMTTGYLHLLDSARILATGWRPRIGLENGLRALAPEIDRALGARGTA